MKIQSIWLAGYCLAGLVMQTGPVSSAGFLQFPGIPKIDIKLPRWPEKSPGAGDKPAPAPPPEKPRELPATIPAAEAALAAAKDRDKPMWQYVLGTMHLRKGDHDQARSYFNRALQTVDARFGKDRNAARARNYMRSESVKTFLGEPYERSMANFYAAILEWMRGDIQAARPYFRNAQWEDSFPEGVETRYACDFALFDYLWGLGAVKIDADPGNSLELARAVTNTVLVGTHSPPPLPDFNRAANVLVFVEYGLGPFKYSDGNHKQLLKFKGTRHPTTAARLKLGQSIHLLPPIDDVTFQAMTRGGRVMDAINKRKAVFKDTTKMVGAAALATSGVMLAARVDERAALIVLGIGVAIHILDQVGIIKPQADTRCWYNLPQFLSFHAMELPPGKYSGEVEFLDANRQVLPGHTKSVSFTVEAKRDTVVFVSELN